MYARGGNTIYLYGGLTGDVYPVAGEQAVEVETPFMSAQTPATLKMLTGFDIGCFNEWSVEILVDPNDSTKSIDVGRITRTTYAESAVRLPGRTSMVAVRLVCDRAGAATISSMAVHFESEGAL